MTHPLQSAAAAQLRAYRDDRRMTQRHLATELGITPGTVTRIESCTMFPRAHIVNRIALLAPDIAHTFDRAAFARVAARLTAAPKPSPSRKTEHRGKRGEQKSLPATPVAFTSLPAMFDHDHLMDLLADDHDIDAGAFFRKAVVA